MRCIILFILQYNNDTTRLPVPGRRPRGTTLPLPFPLQCCYPPSYAALPSAIAFFSFLVGAVLFLLAQRKPQAWHQKSTLPPKLKYDSVKTLTLHRVFGPRGPFRHSGLSVRPQVTQTCSPSASPPPPLLPAPAPPAPLAPAGPETEAFF